VQGRAFDADLSAALLRSIFGPTIGTFSIVRSQVPMAQKTTPLRVRMIENHEHP